MKYYSEITKSVFNTAEELEAAEKKIADEAAAKKKAEEERSVNRKKDAEAIEAARNDYKEAYKLYSEAFKRYQDLMKAFIEKYGQYHATYKSDNWQDLADYFFSNLNLF